MSFAINNTNQNSDLKKDIGFKVKADGGWGLQRVVLLMLILQSVGIRAFPYQGVIVSLTICFVLVNRIKASSRQVFWFLSLTVTFVLLSLRGNSDYVGVIYFSLILFTAFFCVRYIDTRWEKAEFDVLKITWLLSLHGLTSYCIYNFYPEIFSSMKVEGPAVKNFGIFIVNSFESDQIRATGFCWEPGLLQFVANISLFLGIKNFWSRWKLAVSFITVLVTFSTTGIFALALNIIYFLILRRKSTGQWILAGSVVVIFITLSVFLFKENILHKLGGENTSGLIRLRDLQVGWELIQQNLLLGHGLFDQNYLLSNRTVSEIAVKLFSEEFLAIDGDYAGGYTNGFLGYFISYGLILGAISYLFFFRNRLIQGGLKEHLFFFLISIVTFFSEPITKTPLFFFLLISGIYVGGLNRFYIKKRKLFFTGIKN